MEYRVCLVYSYWLGRFNIEMRIGGTGSGEGEEEFSKMYLVRWE